jgi:hypothetical protein
MEISEKEYKELKSHSQMLGMIGAYVEEFCDEEDTTLTGLIKLLSDYYALKGENLMFLANQEKGK